jgi:hypothetical protein
VLVTLQLKTSSMLPFSQTYVPWCVFFVHFHPQSNASTSNRRHVVRNLHQPEKNGDVLWTGLLDLPRFLDTAHKVGLLVVLRPPPYICAEWFVLVFLITTLLGALF